MDWKKKIKKCKIRGRTFYLECRLEKHADIHEEPPTPCKYIQSRNTCPFAEVGCKCDHKKSESVDDKVDRN